MVRYRRDCTPGATYFFTVALRNRRAKTLTAHYPLLRDAFVAARREAPFETVAMVVLPDHLHTVWTLPDGDADYPARWRSVKSAFVRSLRTIGVASTRDAKGRAMVWQARYWEHRIRDEADLAVHVEYIHFNPVKHGHAGRASDWRYSSIHAYIRRGWVTRDWAIDVGDAGRFGE